MAKVVAEGTFTGNDSVTINIGDWAAQTRGDRFKLGLVITGTWDTASLSLYAAVDDPPTGWGIIRNDAGGAAIGSAGVMTSGTHVYVVAVKANYVKLELSSAGAGTSINYAIFH